MHTMGGGRFFAGGSGDGDRRMRPHHHPNQQALECPRCNSLHTKFCYYNNYNLSQPRHFCKSCRRYWTKGGVLRNVPVGGGCRKSKRSNPKISPTSENATCASPPTTTAAVTPAALPPAATQQELKSISHSSCESESRTAANTASANTTEAVSTPTQNAATNLLHPMHEPNSLVNSENGIPHFEPGLLEQAAESEIFSEIGCFTSLIPSSSEALPFGLGNMTDSQSFRFNQLCSDHLVKAAGQHNHDLKFPETTGWSMLDHTVQDDLSELQNQPENSGSGFGSLDWHGVVDDLPHHNPVDLKVSGLNRNT